MSFSSEEEKKERSDPESENFVFHPLSKQTSTSPKYKPTYKTCEPTFDVPQNIPYHEFCSKCGTEHHPRSSYCPVLPPCKTCFDPQHTSADCPFFSHIPKGAFFDRVNYEIICGCGNIFNEDKWVCSRCNGRPKLQSKYCHICPSRYVQHSSHECPNDKESAAEYKAIRDQNLSRKYIPYTDPGNFVLTRPKFVSCQFGNGEPIYFSTTITKVDPENIPSYYSSKEVEVEPKDKVGAAQFKAKRDQAFSDEKIPYTG